jgi:hypothetical protein
VSNLGGGSEYGYAIKILILYSHSKGNTYLTDNYGVVYKESIVMSTEKIPTVYYQHMGCS